MRRFFSPWISRDFLRLRQKFQFQSKYYYWWNNIYFAFKVSYKSSIRFTLWFIFYKLVEWESQENGQKRKILFVFLSNLIYKSKLFISTWFLFMNFAIGICVFVLLFYCYLSFFFSFNFFCSSVIYKRFDYNHRHTFTFEHQRKLFFFLETIQMAHKAKQRKRSTHTKYWNSVVAAVECWYCFFFSQVLKRFHAVIEMYTCSCDGGKKASKTLQFSVFGYFWHLLNNTKL